MGLSVGSAFIAGALAIDAISFGDRFKGGYAGVAALSAYFFIMAMLRTLVRNEASGGKSG
jgi:hypothetical protein